MRVPVGDRRGQALPITVLFSALIVGAAALTVDVGRVYVMRNQASAAVSAAVLAAAQTLTHELNLEVAANPTQPPSITTLDTADAIAAGDAVYQSNIKSALRGSNFDQNPTFTFQPVTTQYLSGYSPSSPQYQKWSPYQGMVVVQAVAQGTAPMDFAVMLGVPKSTVTAQSTAMVGLQNGVPTSALLPLAIPASGDDPSASLPIPSNTWEQYIAPGQTYYLYRGNSSGKEDCSFPPGTPTGAIAVSYHNLFGAGNDGALALNSAGAYVDIGSSVQGQTGSAEWNTLSSLPVGETVILPVGDSVHNGSGSVQMVGFVTAKVLASNGEQGTNAGFVIQITNVHAATTLASLEGVGSGSSSYSPTFSYRLIPNF